MRGRKPVPTVVQIARGNPGKRRLNEHEPMPDQPRTLDPPEWLQGDARAEWINKAAMLDRLGLLTEADLHALELYCQTYAQWREAQRMIDQFGLIVQSTKGFPAMSPWLHVAHMAQAQMMKLLIEFGLTPSSRSRVASAKPGGGLRTDADRKARFFGGSHVA
jgi:P27 family predicted phage terminase small subunit